MTKLVPFALLLLLAGCAAPGTSFSRPDFTRITNGMAKADVIKRLGKPTTSSAEGTTEVILYGWDDPFDGRIGAAEWHYVAFSDGLAVGWGRSPYKFQPDGIPPAQIIAATAIGAPAASPLGPKGVIETRIDGDFEGWEGETVWKMVNGQIWQQDEPGIYLHLALDPEVIIYPDRGGYKMLVKPIGKAIRVKLLR